MNRPSGLKANRPLLFLPAAKTAVWACFYSDIRIQCIVLSIIHAEVRYERDQGLYLHSGGVLPLGRVRAAGQPILRRRAGPRRVPVRALMGDPGKCGKAVRPALSGTAPRSRQDKHLTNTRLHLKHPQKGSERYDLRRGLIPPISERRRRRA